MLIIVVLAEWILQALVLIPRESLQDFIESGADPWAMITIVIDNYRKCPNDADVRRHMLDVMHKVLDSHRPATDIYGRVLTELRSWSLIRTTILTTGWKLGDIPLYHKAIRSCAVGGVIPGDLVTKLASFVNKLSSSQQPDWDKQYVCLQVVLHRIHSISLSLSLTPA